MVEPDLSAMREARPRPWVTTSSLPTDAGSPVSRVGASADPAIWSINLRQPVQSAEHKAQRSRSLCRCRETALRKRARRGAAPGERPHGARAAPSAASRRGRAARGVALLLLALDPASLRESPFADRCSQRHAAVVLALDTSLFAACDAASTKTPRPVSQGACESSDTRLLNAAVRTITPFRQSASLTPFVPLYKPRQCLRLRYSAAIDAC